MKHTPGPWRIATTGNYGNTIEAQSGRKQYEFDTGYRAVGTFQSCEATGLHKQEEENRLANGLLMACAPELLHALKEMEKYFGKYPEFVPNEDNYFEYRAAIENARNIISKATGSK